jgi:hypothetical protein
MTAGKKITLYRPLLVDIPGLDLNLLRKQAKKKQARVAKRSEGARQNQPQINEPLKLEEAEGKDPLCVIFPNGLGF